jgi:hypothetical protein
MVRRGAAGCDGVRQGAGCSGREGGCEVRFAPGVLAATMLAALALFAAPVAAQTVQPRVFITAGGGVQGGGSAQTDRLEWEVHRETADATVDYSAGSSPWFGGGVGVRVWRQLGAGVAFSRARRDGPATLVARIPHPFHFDQRREITGEAPALARSEAGVHLQVLYLVPSQGRIRMILAAGPSRFTAEQDVVNAVRFTEDYPFDEAAFQRADTLSRSASAMGFHLGADIAYMFTRAIGLAGVARFTRATVRLSRPDGGRLSLDAGGMQGGVALRLVF